MKMTKDTDSTASPIKANTTWIKLKKIITTNFKKKEKIKLTDVSLKSEEQIYYKYYYKYPHTPT